MAKGNKIVVSSPARGVVSEGTISGTPKPGTCMEVKAAALVNNRPVVQVYTPGTDGLQRVVMVLSTDWGVGKLPTDAYADGDHCFLYFPLPGEQLNMLVADVAGTADDHAIGDLYIIKSGTGKLIANTGSPGMISFVGLEAATDPTADALMWMMFTGQ